MLAFSISGICLALSLVLFLLGSLIGSINAMASLRLVGLSALLLYSGATLALYGIV